MKNILPIRKESGIKKSELTLPEIALIGGTRALLGAGVALLVAEKLDQSQRKSIGWTLLAVGAVTTIPLAMNVFGKRR